MDAWETLVSNSSLADGDAWQHLNAQKGRFGVLLLDGLVIEMDDRCVEVEIDQSAITVEVADYEYDVEVETQEYIVEVCE